MEQSLGGSKRCVCVCLCMSVCTLIGTYVHACRSSDGREIFQDKSIENKHGLKFKNTLR